MANDDSADRGRGAWWHGPLGWLAGTALAYALASLAHTQTVLAGLSALGVRIPLGTRLATSAGDLAGLWRYAVVIGLALALGLALVQLLSRPFGAPSLPVRGALAGAAGVAAALLAMRLAFSFTPIASAREPLGFALQCLAGATGGLAWAGTRTYLAARARRRH